MSELYFKEIEKALEKINQSMADIKVNCDRISRIIELEQMNSNDSEELGIKECLLPVRGEVVILTIDKVMAKLGIGKNKALDLMHRQDFPSFKLSNKWMVHEDKLNEWLFNQSK